MNRNRAEKRFSRLVFDDIPIYVDPDGPNWFVPNSAGDQLLKNEITADCRDIVHTVARRRFLGDLPGPASGDYPGRSAYLTLSHLEECWLHITDHCNLACRHCLFSCSPKSRKTLPFDQISRIVAEAYTTGVRVFYLTGGEPTMHPDFLRICRMILSDKPDTVLVILTNGMLLDTVSAFLGAFPKDRLFLQISIDGLAHTHDHIRGNGSFEKLTRQLASAEKQLSCAKTLAMAVHAENAAQMADIIATADLYGISNVHFIWLLTTGNAGAKDFTGPETLFSNLKDAAVLAEKTGITIDNFKSMASRVFSPANTRHDLSNAGWRSIAVGPDGVIYPTAALVGQPSAACGLASDGIGNVWQNSPFLADLRGLSVNQSATWANDPLKFIIGGGDMDHCFYAAGSFIDGDPYLPLYRNITLLLIHREASVQSDDAEYPRIRLKMGDRVEQCRMDGNGVALTHSNCVLTGSEPGNPIAVAGDFYNTAARNVNTDITNPVCYPEAVMDHVPKSARVRSYGCGSPVLDANIQDGETVVDLGSGAGMECFIAARQAGRNGRVFGIDMSDPMIEIAENLKTGVANNLGYDNIRFLKGMLEAIPLPDNSTDVVISNCVINLSGNKRRIFSEIFRILKPGGRIMIADVVCDEPIPPHIAGDEKLRGECLAGAMLQPYLLSMLESSGFAGIRLEKRFFYRETGGHRFYSLTYSAGRTDPNTNAKRVYPGPFAAVITDDGHVRHRGEPFQGREMAGNQSAAAHILLQDDQGTMAGVDAQNPCGCALPPSSPPTGDKEISAVTHLPGGEKTAGAENIKHTIGCTLCGKPLVYLEQDIQKTCSFCSETFMTNTVCRDDHFVCNICHGGSVLEYVRHICLGTGQTDMIEIAETLRAHPAFPVHGPEHHFMVPAVILAAYRNAGGTIADEAIMTGIDRARAIPGGSCAFWGCCGAAVGAGIALSIILGANPLIAGKRRMVQQAVGKIITAVGFTEAARCCRRETLTVLAKTAELSGTLLSVQLTAENFSDCRQAGKNKECIRDACAYLKSENRTARRFQTK